MFIVAILRMNPTIPIPRGHTLCQNFSWVLSACHELIKATIHEKTHWNARRERGQRAFCWPVTRKRLTGGAQSKRVLVLSYPSVPARVGLWRQPGSASPRPASGSSAINSQVSVERESGDDGNEREHEDVASERTSKVVNTKHSSASFSNTYSRGVLKANCNP